MTWYGIAEFMRLIVMPAGFTLLVVIGWHMEWTWQAPAVLVIAFYISTALEDLGKISGRIKDYGD